MEEVILVNNQDKKIGISEKLKAHKEGLLHRSFSILVFNLRGQLLVQKRAKGKYHSGGLWSNTCCSHPKSGEKIEEAIHRRLEEEMGFDCDLQEIFSFIYKTKINNLIEYEYDHVFIGRFNGNFKPNLIEVEDWQWKKMEELHKDIIKNPNKYTYWFKIIIKKFKK